MAQLDTLPGLHPGPAGSVTRGQAITPDDHHLLPVVARRIYVGGAGDLRVTLRDDSQPVTLKNLPINVYELWVKQVWNTGTTATLLVGLS